MAKPTPLFSVRAHRLLQKLYPLYYCTTNMTDASADELHALMELHSYDLVNIEGLDRGVILVHINDYGRRVYFECEPPAPEEKPKKVRKRRA